MTEQELVKALSSCNPEAYRELTAKYQSTIIRTCYSLVHDYHDAEDLAQEVFLEVFKSISRFKGNSGLATWLYRISVNKSLNFIRSKKKSAIFEQIEMFFNGKNDAGIIDEHQSRESVENEEKENTRRAVLHWALNQLPENQRTAFVLHKYDELPYKEISEVMNRSLSSIESLIHRAKKNLQKNIVSHYKKQQ